MTAMDDYQLAILDNKSTVLHDGDIGCILGRTYIWSCSYNNGSGHGHGKGAGYGELEGAGNGRGRNRLFGRRKPAMCSIELAMEGCHG